MPLRSPENSAAPDAASPRRVAAIVAAYVSRNHTPASELPNLIRLVSRALGELSGAHAPAAGERPKPAAPIAKSVTDDYIICLEDGKKLKMLKRYLRSAYAMSPDEYRKRWSLPADYPMVAPAYAARRSAFAKSIGLGKGARKKG